MTVLIVLAAFAVGALLGWAVSESGLDARLNKMMWDDLMDGLDRDTSDISDTDDRRVEE